VIKGKSAIHLVRTYGERQRNFAGQHRHIARAHIALPGSPVFQTPFQHAAVLRSDSNYHARLSTAD
jgi:hypothetical protein